jgi:hypothetical protein
VSNLAGGKLPLCGIAAAFIVCGACLAVWPRRFVEPGEDRPGEPPTAAQVWGARVGGVFMVLGGVALLAVVLADVPPDPDPVLF